MARPIDGQDAADVRDLRGRAAGEVHDPERGREQQQVAEVQHQRGDARLRRDERRARRGSEAVVASSSHGVASMPARVTIGARIRATAATMRLKRRGSESMPSKLRADSSPVVARRGDCASAARGTSRSSARPMKTRRRAGTLALMDRAQRIDIAIALPDPRARRAGRAGARAHGPLAGGRGGQRRRGGAAPAPAARRARRGRDRAGARARPDLRHRPAVAVPGRADPDVHRRLRAAPAARAARLRDRAGVRDRRLQLRPDRGDRPGRRAVRLLPAGLGRRARAARPRGAPRGGRAPRRARRARARGAGPRRGRRGARADRPRAARRGRAQRVGDGPAGGRRAPAAGQRPGARARAGGARGRRGDRAPGRPRAAPHARHPAQGGPRRRARRPRPRCGGSRSW